MEKRIKPILKWAGGKRQLLSKIVPDIEQNLTDESTYFEPFLGGAAVLFSLQPKKAIVNDYNQELINMYKTVKDYPNELIHELKKHKNTKDHFYETRKLDRKECFRKMSSPMVAARMIYLNKTCFNGLYRVNSKGHFNVPFANNKNPLIVDTATIKGVSNYFKNNDIYFLNLDFEKAVETAKKGDYVYFDPPYIPLSSTASFTSYTKKSFNMKDQIRLRDLAKRLKIKGVNFTISNSDTKEVRELYSDENYFFIETVSVSRNINSNAKKRNGVTEVLIRNRRDL